MPRTREEQNANALEVNILVYLSRIFSVSNMGKLHFYALDLVEFDKNGIRATLIYENIGRKTLIEMSKDHLDVASFAPLGMHIELIVSLDDRSATIITNDRDKNSEGQWQLQIGTVKTNSDLDREPRIIYCQNAVIRLFQVIKKDYERSGRLCRLIIEGLIFIA